MKTFISKLLTAQLILSLSIGMVALSGCHSQDEPELCSDFECLHGGEKIAGTDGCQCDCPPGYTGINCEISLAECPATIECPAGKSPNPARDCVCE